MLKLALNLVDLFHFILQLVGFLGQLRELLLLRRVHGAQIVKLLLVAGRGERAVNGKAEGTDKENGGRRAGSRAVFNQMHRQADAVHLFAFIGNNLDQVFPILVR